MTPRRLTRTEGAACLVAILERRGAVFTLDEDDRMHCDLNGCPDITDEAEAEELALIVLALRDEIRGHLIAQRTTH